jgi:hypothetical protein
MDAIIMRSFMQGNPSMGFGPGSAVYDYAANYANTPQGRINSRNAQNLQVVNPLFIPGGGGSKSGPNRRAMKPAASGMLVRGTKRPLRGYGKDTVPAALTPGEVVLNEEQKSAVMPIPGREHLLLPEQLMALQMTAGRTGRSMLPRP